MSDKVVDPMVLADISWRLKPLPVIANIDSRANERQTDKDAIVNVFLKVFNQMQGFCGSIPHVADLERAFEDIRQFKLLLRRVRRPWEDSAGL